VVGNACRWLSLALHLAQKQGNPSMQGGHNCNVPPLQRNASVNDICSLHSWWVSGSAAVPHPPVIVSATIKRLKETCSTAWQPPSCWVVPRAPSDATGACRAFCLDCIPTNWTTHLRVMTSLGAQSALDQCNIVPLHSSGAACIVRHTCCMPVACRQLWWKQTTTDHQERVRMCIHVGHSSRSQLGRREGP
jgi:hypothetical protein